MKKIALVVFSVLALAACKKEAAPPTSLEVKINQDLAGFTALYIIDDKILNDSIMHNQDVSDDTKTAIKKYDNIVHGDLVLARKMFVGKDEKIKEQMDKTRADLSNLTTEVIKQ